MNKEIFQQTADKINSGSHQNGLLHRIIVFPSRIIKGDQGRNYLMKRPWKGYLKKEEVSVIVDHVHVFGDVPEVSAEFRLLQTYKDLKGTQEGDHNMDGNGGDNCDGNNNEDRAGGAPGQTVTTFAFGTIEQLRCQHQEMQQGQEQTENITNVCCFRKTPTSTPAVQVETGSEADHGEVETPDGGRSRRRQRSESEERARKEREVRR
ncbi:unnamed protein product [Mucor circinelloides]